MPPLPVLEDGTQEEKLCYVLGWLEEEVSKQIMEVAGYRPRNRGEAAYQETYVRGLHYMSRTSHYFHIWTTYGFKPGCEITKALGPDATLEDGGPPLLALCCSVERAYHRRPSKAQFEWFKTVVGTETRWHLIDRSFYIIEEKVGSLWAPQKCCPPVCSFLPIRLRRLTYIIAAQRQQVSSRGPRCWEMGR